MPDEPEKPTGDAGDWARDAAQRGTETRQETDERRQRQKST